LFVTEELSGDQLATIVTAEDSGLSIGGRTAAVPALEPKTARLRCPSRARLDSTIVLPWPVVEYRLPLADTTSPLSSLGGDGTMLIGEDCPSFPYFWTAFDAFFRPGSTRASNRNQPQPRDLGKLRIVQARTWLDRVRITATTVEVQLGGDVVENVRIELNSIGLFSRGASDSQGRLQLTMPDGLPDDAWLYVTKCASGWTTGGWARWRRGRKILPARASRSRSLRTLTPRSARSWQPVKACMWSTSGNYRARRSTPSPRCSRPWRRSPTARAATIVFGMDPDELTVIGISEDYKEVRDRLGRLIRGNVVPPNPGYDISRTTVDQKQLILLEV
jgi:hypothetical protein